MRKKLTATSTGPGGSSSTYEVTVDDTPPIPGSATNLGSDDDDDSNLPEGVKLAVVAGDIEKAKALLEQAGYEVEITDLA